MKNVILLFVINIVVVIGFFAALSMKTPWVGFAIAFSVWFIYLWKSTNT
ncbi:hypothetical protein ACFU8T_07700 [Sphingobacterium spiritivorum]|uniref:Uncharacterized protein n=1 Tax=Sphingobacterium spiritivorum ATCC 33861 TaxID=525373 RepID=D7VTE3_SPHSI|nr:hypothetical protein [Sphingobacterium spiritivorum]EFK57044.1 hypothetical protein HMPREF0766_14247 [Sphingobacterium spiritivorum ATCC 33861]QQT34951.1 hypothetical protein I6J01_16870 [Sphingobacterium spiritivorum]WQD35846.1 hypothetical protein U0038_08815 [Sphingobacterium spiritivorum]SUJ02828.1 Uncharacterised protein [Sphingobacterium spiritivorum]